MISIMIYALALYSPSVNRQTKIIHATIIEVTYLYKLQYDMYNILTKIYTLIMVNQVSVTIGNYCYYFFHE